MEARTPATRSARPFAWRAVCLTLLALVASGCARLPRIDPSGERIFLPANQPPVIGPLGQSAPGFGTPGGFAPTPSNVAAPPVFGQGQSSGLLGLGLLGGGGPTIVGPAVGPPQPGTPIAVPPAAPAGPLRSRLANCDLLNDRISGDRVVITPQKVLAPVGTEVIVRAGVCGEDGYLRTNRRIDWLLAKQGAGEFVQVGEAGERDLGRFPWRTPEKHDNHYAIGYTSPFHTCLRRGNADPLDDVQVRKGDAWITVTSASEGTSYLTAAAPSVENWDTRRASTVIYWVDAQWQFPPSVAVPAGSPHTLTTVVTRQSDGAPIEGWIVRYQVQDPNAARLGYDAGEAQEVATDNRGRASVELTPTDSAAGATTVNITVVRPEQAGVAASPRINVGRGSTTINWTGAAGQTPPPVLPPIDGTPPTRPPTPDFQPPGSPPPAPPQPTGRPRLEATLKRLTPDPIREGDTVAYEVLVQNRGDGVARNILVTDRFDNGLTNQFDTEGKNEIEYPGMRDLVPNDSEVVRLEFSVLQAGRRRHDVTVSADGPPGQPRVEAFDQASFTAEPLSPAAPTLDVRFQRPTPFQATEGDDRVDFVAIVENTGPVAAENVVVTFKTDAGVLPVIERTQHRPDLGEQFRDFAEGPNQVLEYIFPRIDPGRQRQLEFRGSAKRSTAVNTRVTIEARTPAGGDAIDEAFLEVLPAPPTPGPGAGPAGPPAPIAIQVLETANPTAVGRRMQLNILVTNVSASPLRSVTAQVFVPPQFEPDLRNISPRTYTERLDRTITFDAVAELRPNEDLRFFIPLEAKRQGLAAFEINVRSDEAPNGVTERRQITVNAR